MEYYTSLIKLRIMQNNPVCCLQSYPFIVKVIQEEGRHQIQAGGVSFCGEN